MVRRDGINISGADTEGFTLVELSIVLVLIGLLIGGILAGKNLIETASGYKHIREIQSFKISYDNFVYTFKEKPGDFSRRIEMIGGNSNGNGNGLIEWSGEAPKFWSDLQRTNYPDLFKEFSNPAPYLYLIRNKNADNLVGQRFYYGFTGDLYAPCNDGGIGSEDTITLANDGPAGGAVNTSSIRASALMGIDRKMDDGLPYSGKVRGNGGRDNESPYTDLMPCSITVNGLREYNVTESKEACRMLFLLEKN